MATPLSSSSNNTSSFAAGNPAVPADEVENHTCWSAIGRMISSFFTRLSLEEITQADELALVNRTVGEFREHEDALWRNRLTALGINELSPDEEAAVLEEARSDGHIAQSIEDFILEARLFALLDNPNVALEDVHLQARIDAL